MINIRLIAIVLPLFSWSIILGQAPSPAFRIGILGCHRQFEPAPALFRYLEADPDLCLWIGDNVYADTEDDITYIDSCYQTLAAKPAFKELMKKYPYVVTWDDHDFGLNDAGKDYPLKAQSKSLFRSFWKLEDRIPAAQNGIYYSQYFEHQDKTIQVILLDCRYNRDTPGTNGDVLGEEQWQWLEKELETTADLRLIISGFQILLDSDSGSETWENFPDARKRLFELIRQKQAENVVFLTGDQHYGEVCRSRGTLDFDAIELQFAGINQIEDPEFNSYRVSNVITSKHSYALLDIYLEKTEYDVPHLQFQIFDGLSNQRELFYRINLDEVRLQVDFPEQTYFVDSYEIPIQHSYNNLNLHYTIDGSEPTAASAIVDGSIVLMETATVKTRFFDKQGRPRSIVKEKEFTKLEPYEGVDLKDLQPGLKYDYYEGNFTQLPDFKDQQVVQKGIATSFDVEKLAKREDHYAIVFDGFIEIPEDGIYTFFTYSDDGSRLYVHDQLVVDNDGSHSARRKTGQVPLKKGLHPIRIEYFEDYEGQTLAVGYGSLTLEEQPLSFEALFYN